ncbi:MtN3-like protein [Phytophthora palmivora]|uniref:Sugar transporter SWEET1 n=1 Tax=Phytophthora palmivora TaxID=4796 RepID=A0A2P4Y6R9_9STRA|nr:MtN3-like protein [Phytophthora palmivora]
MLSLSLGPDMYKIHRRKSIGDMPALPLICTLPNTHLWMLYGYLEGSIFPVGVTQGFGQLASIVFNVVYFRWTPKHKRKELLKSYAWALTLHVAVTLYFVLVIAGVTGQTHAEASTSLGYFGLAFSVGVFASPLGTLKRVIETKSAVSIPVNMSLMIFVSSVLWVATGLLDSDYFIAGLNAAGVLLGAIQIVLYYAYRPGRGDNQFQGQHDEFPLVLSPVDKGAGLSVSTTSPVYKTLSSPIIYTAA